MGPVHQSVENRFADGGVWQQRGPLGEGNVAGEGRDPALVPVEEAQLCLPAAPEDRDWHTPRQVPQSLVQTVIRSHCLVRGLLPAGAQHGGAGGAHHGGQCGGCRGRTPSGGDMGDAHL